MSERNDEGIKGNKAKDRKRGDKRKEKKGIGKKNTTKTEGNEEKDTNIKRK